MDAAASGAIIAPTNDADADGEVVWSWRSDAGAKVAECSANDGGNQAMVTEESSKETVKTIAQGMPVDAVYLWFCRVLFVARGPWVRWAPGLPCALLIAGR